MGTNYYLHLGKRSSRGRMGCKFYLAVPLPLADHMVGGVTVVDEYGHEMTYAAFWQLVKDDERDPSGLGQQFT